MDGNSPFYFSKALKALALWLGLAAVMVQSLAPFCLAGAMNTAGAGATMVICTANGAETVHIGDDGKILPSKPGQADPGSGCSSCVTCHGAGGYVPPMRSLLIAAAPSQPKLDGANAPASPRAPHFIYVTRGPPREPLNLAVIAV